MVVLVEHKEELEVKLAEAGDALVVIDFFATWCGPCKMIAPKFEDLSKKYPDIIFLKVNVEESDDIATEYEVSSMPTFVFIKNSKKLYSFAGASIEKLEESIKKYK